MKVLIVDDEQDIGMMVSMFLRKAGLEVDYVSRVGLAEDKIQSGQKGLYNIFFLDLNLPDGTGFDLIPLIRSKSNSAKIIIISAHDGIMEKRRAQSFEVDAFIKKPFTKRDIISSVEEFVSPPKEE